jgi:hypothetical protein
MIIGKNYTMLTGIKYINILEEKNLRYVVHFFKSCIRCYRGVRSIMMEISRYTDCDDCVRIHETIFALEFTSITYKNI